MTNIRRIPRQLLPDITMVLESITSFTTLEMFNYERYEVLGDSFLKYACSLFLYDVYPRKNEGQLSIRKHKLVSNGTLARVCRHWGIHKYLRYSKFDLAFFRPPGMKEQYPIEYSVIRGKVIADMMESLIGTYFLKLGSELGRVFLRFLKILPSPEEIERELNEESMWLKAKQRERV